MKAVLMLATYRRALFGVVFAVPLLAGGSAIANNSHSDNNGPAPSAPGHHTVGSLGTTHTLSGSTGHHHAGGGGSGNSRPPRCLPARHGHPATCPPPNGGGTTGGGTAGGGTTGGNGNGSQGGGQANNGGNDQGGNGGQGDQGGNGGNQGGGQANNGGNDQGGNGGQGNQGENGGNQGGGQANNGGNDQGDNGQGGGGPGDQGDNGQGDQGGIGGNGQGGTGNGDQGGGYAGGGSDDCTLDNLTTCKSDNSDGGGDPGCTTADLCGPPANIPNIATAVPEPASVLLFGAGIAAVMARRRKADRTVGKG